MRFLYPSCVISGMQKAALGRSRSGVQTIWTSFLAFLMAVRGNPRVWKVLYEFGADGHATVPYSPQHVLTNGSDLLGQARRASRGAEHEEHALTNYCHPDANAHNQNGRVQLHSNRRPKATGRQKMGQKRGENGTQKIGLRGNTPPPIEN